MDQIDGIKRPDVVDSPFDVAEGSLRQICRQCEIDVAVRCGVYMRSRAKKVKFKGFVKVVLNDINNGVNDFLDTFFNCNSGLRHSQSRKMKVK